MTAEERGMQDGLIDTVEFYGWLRGWPMDELILECEGDLVSP